MQYNIKVKVEVKAEVDDTWHSASLWANPITEAYRYRHTFARDHTILPATHAFIHELNEPYLPLPFQPKLVLMYWPRKDERLSWPRHRIVIGLRAYLPNSIVMCSVSQHCCTGCTQTFRLSQFDNYCVFLRIYAYSSCSVFCCATSFPAM